MNIVFGIREDYAINRGGDTFQMLKTKEYLEKYEDIGEIRVVTTPNELIGKIDILHVFNLQTTQLTYSLIRKAKEMQAKVVLSPIIWKFGDSCYVNKMMRITNNFKLTCRMHKMSILFEWYATQKNARIKKEILRMADVVAPNSMEESEILRQQYKVDFVTTIVPNCIDKEISEGKTKNERKAILQIGRIEPTKNQMAVLLAMMNHKEIPLYFIGKQNKEKLFYINKLKKLAIERGNTFFIEELSQGELVKYYENSKVHVLPSFRESPGLVTLEALFYGCNIVFSNERYCPIKYYRLDKYGAECDPYSIKSVEQAILQEYVNEQPNISAEYFKIFNYENAAKITHDIYLELVEKKGSKK